MERSTKALFKKIRELFSAEIPPRTVPPHLPALNSILNFDQQKVAAELANLSR